MLFWFLYRRPIFFKRSSKFGNLFYYWRLFEFLRRVFFMNFCFLNAFFFNFNIFHVTLSMMIIGFRGLADIRSAIAVLNFTVNNIIFIIFGLISKIDKITITIIIIWIKSWIIESRRVIIEKVMVVMMRIIKGSIATNICWRFKRRLHQFLRSIILLFWNGKYRFLWVVGILLFWDRKILH